MSVVSDTTPLHYLVLIGCADVLPALFETLVIPGAVHAELRHPHAPSEVRDYAAALPAWLRVEQATEVSDAALDRLDAGEREAIVLAEQRAADLILLDERFARSVARRRGLRMAGTLGVLDAAAQRGLVDLDAAVARLRRTNARLAPALLDQVLERRRAR